MWLCSVTVWLFSREGVAKSPCKCGSVGGIYTSGVPPPLTLCALPAHEVTKGRLSRPL